MSKKNLFGSNRWRPIKPWCDILSVYIPSGFIDKIVWIKDSNIPLVRDSV